MHKCIVRGCNVPVLSDQSAKVQVETGTENFNCN